MTARRILNAWERLPPSIQQAGLEWYPEASERARELAKESGYSHAVACGVIARLSPAIRWSHNLKIARIVLLTGKATGYSGYPRNADNAIRILSEGWTDAPAGPKINAFYRNILDPTDPHPVTIDRHILTWLRIDKQPHVAAYRRLAVPWQRAAAQSGIRANALQAGIWLSTPLYRDGASIGIVAEK